MTGYRVYRVEFLAGGIGYEAMCENGIVIYEESLELIGRRIKREVFPLMHHVQAVVVFHPQNDFVYSQIGTRLLWSLDEEERRQFFQTFQKG